LRRGNPSIILVSIIVLSFSLLTCCGFNGNENGPAELPGRESGFSGLRSGPTVFVEIFPVFLNESGILALVPNHSKTWQIPLPAAGHAHGHVEEELGDRGVEAEIIHSTSWRQDGEKVVLTFLAVIRPPEEMPKGWSVMPVARSELAHSGAKTPPPEIPSGAVLTHALQHLSWLYETDLTVRENLSTGWEGILASFRPMPAMSMDDER